MKSVDLSFRIMVKKLRSTKNLVVIQNNFEMSKQIPFKIRRRSEVFSGNPSPKKSEEKLSQKNPI